MALIDQATGRVWNERNRYAANQQFLWDMEDACDQDSTIPTERNGCKRTANFLYYTAVRDLAGYRTENAAERTHFTANQKFDVINGGGTLPGSAAVSCAHGNLTDRENSTNRCLPIYRLELNGKPFAPQKISRFPSDAELQLQVVRANLQSIKGPPHSYSATLAAYEPLNTGDLRLRAKYPLMISESSNITCSSSSTYTYVYADNQNYALPQPNDQLLKSTPFYLKMCRVTTSSEESAPLLEIHPVQAVPLPSSSYHPSTGDRINHQEGIKIVQLTASLSPDPDTSIFNNSDNFSAFTLYTGGDLTHGTVVANPGQTDPSLVKIAARDIYTQTCVSEPEIFGSLSGQSNSSTIYMSMCGTGTGKVEIQDPDTGLAVNSYEAITGPPCLESLSALPSAGKITSGTWTNECSSTRRTGKYARFYSFTLSQSTTVTVTSESTEETYLYLLTGGAKTSPILTSDDDISSTNRNSLVTQTLAAGTYTAEVTTYYTGRTGNFIVRLLTPSSPSAPATTGSTVERTVNVGASRTVNVSGQFSGTGITYSASSSRPTVATASIPPLSSTMTITGVAAGTATITVTATNSAGTATQTWPVTVTSAVTAPTAGSATASISVQAGNSTTVNVSGDFSGTGITYSASSSPATVATASIPASSSTMTIRGVAAGTATVTVTATNSGGTATQTYAVTVASTVTDSDTATLTPAPSSITRGSSVSYTVSTTAAGNIRFIANHTGDTGNLSYTTRCNGGANAQYFRSHGATLTLKGCRVGSVTLKLYRHNGAQTSGRTVDENYSLVRTYNINVTESVPAPMASGTPATQSVNVNATTTVDVSGDFTGTGLTYSASSLDATKATASIPASSSIMTITGVAAGSTTITVTATDSAGRTATQAYSVTVTAATTTPTAGGPTIPTRRAVGQRRH